MSCNSSRSTVENPKGFGDTSVNVLAIDSEEQKSKETSTNPSVHQQEGEIDLSTSDALESVNEEKRQRTLSQKAIHNAIQNKSTELNKAEKSLYMSSDTVLTALEKNITDKEIETVLAPLQQAYTKYQAILKDIETLSEQDKWGEARTHITEVTEYAQTALKYASTAMNKAKSQQSRLATKTGSISSKHTRSTKSSRTSATSSNVWRWALAKAAAAQKEAKFEQLMAEKESEKTQREPEQEFHWEQMRAQHERDMAILAAEKRKAVADAKLKAIEQSIREEDTTSILAEAVRPSPPTNEHTGEPPPLSNTPAEEKRDGVTKDQFQSFIPTGFAGNQPIYKLLTTHPEVVIANQCIEGIAQTNQQIVASLASQNLPKCHPDVFDGDATLFHPWKGSFQAMTQDANLSPSQEIAYLRNYTKGNAQDLVNHFRKRQQDDPTATLRGLWKELE
ncbi:Hypothetical predicted protein [Paramuricea clavata]|uniref:Uncharacterized protein n=1 Tax=Paramuricea clavata TaxID=317549 RepID=A0A7D9HE64_PARCT|nr:Hypothetical predicted protein [Paramuricea clavata]